MRRLLSTSIIASVFVPAVAFAGDPTEEMEMLNERGFQAFDDGEFEEAAAVFRQAYERFGDPNLLKNEAIAWYAAKRCDRAREVALEFVRQPDTLSDDRDEMTRLISKCEDDEGEPKKVVTVRPIEDPGAGNQDGSNGMPLVGGALMGLGAALVVGAGLYHVSAYAQSEELVRISEQGGERERHASLSASVGTARVLLPVLYGAGAAMTGAGAWLVFSPSDSGSAAAYGDSEWSVGLSYSGRF